MEAGQVSVLKRLVDGSFGKGVFHGKAGGIFYLHVGGVFIVYLEIRRGDTGIILLLSNLGIKRRQLHCCGEFFFFK